MRSVAIFRHSLTEGPGYFAIFLEACRIPWELIPLDQGASVPFSPEDYSGLCFMGGPMSVNDNLPWIAPVCRLIQKAVKADIPVLGHCLGGQLISKALGGVVGKNPCKEIGWGDGKGETHETARRWLGGFSGKSLPLFHWHSETFSLPENAVLLAGTPYCKHQIFALGKHLAMQCHVEMLPEMVVKWNDQWQDEVISSAHMPSVQKSEAMLSGLPEKLPKMRKLADQLYGQWVKGLAGYP